MNLRASRVDGICSLRADSNGLLLALFGHGAMSDLSPLCAQERTSLSGFVTDPAPTSAFPNAGLSGRD
jgi:hypothetical protein